MTESPPTSPPPIPERIESSRRPSGFRKERPASVIPTTTSPEATGSPQVPPHRDPRIITPRVLFSRDNSKETECLAVRTPSQESVRPASASPRSPNAAERISFEKEHSKDNLSGTSGSLSSISPPSSPSRVKTENEKQEQESNEKCALLGE